ncbi:MAG: histidine phosphatase family protein [Acidimicrobiales bacterium]|nr:histidine phosphatase family protein [Acidimicrobiales bacterium]
MTGRPEIWVVRHGTTEWSATGQHTSRTDLALTPDGERQAAALRPALAGHRFGLVLSSPLLRARRTAELAGFGDRVELTDDLREWDYGELEGLTITQIRDRRGAGWTIWGGDVPGGETGAEVRARTLRVIGRCLATGDDALLFAHGHVLRVLTTTWLELPPTDGARFALDTATVNVLGWEHDGRTLRAWNAVP